MTDRTYVLSVIFFGGQVPADGSRRQFIDNAAYFIKAAPHKIMPAFQIKRGLYFFGYIFKSRLQFFKKLPYAFHSLLDMSDGVGVGNSDKALAALAERVSRNDGDAL